METGTASAGLTAGLDGLRGFFQPKWFWDSMKIVSANSKQKGGAWQRGTVVIEVTGAVLHLPVRSSRK